MLRMFSESGRNNLVLHMKTYIHFVFWTVHFQWWRRE